MAGSTLLAKLRNQLLQYRSIEEIDACYAKDPLFRSHCNQAFFVDGYTKTPAPGVEVRQRSQEQQQTSPHFPPPPPESVIDRAESSGIHNSPGSRSRPAPAVASFFARQPPTRTTYPTQKTVGDPSHHAVIGGSSFHELSGKPEVDGSHPWPRDRRGPPREEHHGLARDGFRDTPSEDYRDHNRRPPPPPPDRPTPKQLNDLRKLYTSAEMKYGGEKHDVMEIKLTILRENCNSARPPISTVNVFVAGGPPDVFVLADAVRSHFETEESVKAYLAEWQQITLHQIEAYEPGKTKAEILELRLLHACRGVPEARLCLFNPSSTLGGVCSQLRSSIATAESAAKVARPFVPYEPRGARQHHHELGHGQHFTDRTYRGNGKDNRSGGKGQCQRRGDRATPTDRRCYVCNQQGCYSTKHTPDERRVAHDKYKAIEHTTGRTGDAAYRAFLTRYGGNDPSSADDGSEEDLTQYNTFKGSQSKKERKPRPTTTSLFPRPLPSSSARPTWTEGPSIIGRLAEPSFPRYLTKADPGIRQHVQRWQPSGPTGDSIDDPTGPTPSIAPSSALSSKFLLDRYSSEVFQGILLATGAAGHSTAGYPQVVALRRSQPAEIDPEGKVTVRFGGGQPIESSGKVTVDTPLGPIDLQVVPVNHPFSPLPSRYGSAEDSIRQPQ
ncbi:hypothetical protein QIS74_02500 [Colletotrichum tabaci]|uniref:Uncharacterized protein n=1 Tax=Colletotrichum tabaci TaxID=1209068 RepID=A0AAV9TRA4_9PEZI